MCASAARPPCVECQASTAEGNGLLCFCLRTGEQLKPPAKPGRALSREGLRHSAGLPKYLAARQRLLKRLDSFFVDSGASKPQPFEHRQPFQVN